MRKNTPGTRGLAAKLAGLMLGIGLALVIVYTVCVLSWPSPGPILPPAGEVVEGDAPFRFAVLGDNRKNVPVLEEILDRIKADKVSFILHTGDIVQNATQGEFDWVVHELHEQKLGIPLCVVPGNHDVEEDKQNTAERCAHYTRAFGPRQYWFACANTLFVAFDDSTARCTPDDLHWLDRTLGRLRDRYDACFVYMHVPPRDPRPGRNHALDEGADELITIMKKHRVSAVFAGHIHTYLEDRTDGIPVFITGGAGATRVEPLGPYHYLLCTVKRDGSFAVEKRDVPVEYSGFDTDFLERNLRVKASQNVILLTGVGFLSVWFVLNFRRSSKRHRGEQSS